ncbi:ABC transporter permease [Vagococcus elongatus]|nr:ABC transporter permease [Vagococcus elongatus]
MLKVNNRKVIKRLARTQMKQQPLKNRLLVLAVALATMMLVAVFSIGINYYTVLNQRNLSMYGSDYNGMLTGPTEEQINVVKEMKKVKTVGMAVGSVTVAEYEGIAVGTSLVWADENHWQEQLQPVFIHLVGSYPQKKEEVMLSEKALKKMGVTQPEVGMVLPMSLAYYDGLRDEEMILSGYFNDYSGKNRGFISKTFYQQSGIKSDDLDRSRLYINFSTPFISEQEEAEMEESLKLNKYQHFFADTEMGDMLFKVAVSVIAIAGVIMISGYLLIYNIVYISLRKEVLYFGLLKTIGTTSRQIREIVFRQIILLSMIGIPAGLILGAGISNYLIPKLVVTMIPGVVSFRGEFQPVIYVLAGFFSLLTIFISVAKPAKSIAQMSPVEAVKQEDMGVKQSNKSKTGSSIRGMAWRNVFRNKKQAILVFLSLFIGMTSFTVVSSIIKNNNAKKILEALEVSDMELLNRSSGDDNQVQVFSKDFISQIESIKGVKAVHPVSALNIDITKPHEQFSAYLKPEFEMAYGVDYEKEGRQMMIDRPENFFGTLVGLDSQQFQQMKKKFQLTISEKEFHEGRVGVIARTLEHNYQGLKALENQRIDYRFENRLLEINIDYVTKPFELFDSIQYNGFFPEIYVSNQYLDRLTGSETFVDHLVIDYQQAYDQETDLEILSMIKENKHIDHESKIERYENMKESENQLLIMGTVIAFVLALLGLLNYINVLSTSIFSRSKDLAVLSSIGMTTQQIKKMLLHEGMIYAGISLLFSVIVGNSLSYLIFSLTNVYEITYEAPLTMLLLLYFFAAWICLFLPNLVYRFIHRDSVVDQLRNN